MRFTVLLAAMLLATSAVASPLTDRIDESPYAIGVGWSFGSAANNSNTSKAVEEFEDSPLVFVDARIGSVAGFNANVGLVLENFAHLIENPGAPPEHVAAVRRSIAMDFTLASPAWALFGPEGLFALVLNGGYIFDAESGEDFDAVRDASSYVFGGVRLLGGMSDDSLLKLDLLVGTSEVLTGVEPFGNGSPVRFRPVLQFDIKDYTLRLMADLGYTEEDPDGFTLSASLPILGR